ncbi:MAG: fasciclin domain-containing protein [Tistlia sp.]
MEIDATGDGVMVDEASVVQADVMADNGVIHVIDQVVMP